MFARKSVQPGEIGGLQEGVSGELGDERVEFYVWCCGEEGFKGVDLGGEGFVERWLVA